MWSLKIYSLSSNDIKEIYILFTHCFGFLFIYLCRCQIEFTANMRLDGEVLSLNV